ncbi:hypothetical protein DV096_10090 [Bradymonadaceae bacterium TMQ3]|uniref:Uncharacterized protein n=1 Tax=Lujinxingia sediminis TaxID=2480984 RepID=A0ABY0CSY4_9DELT|nr:hypothetical protein [Lujinxingia sediminis]RDV38154.1 hypothetical protein DV096_10090 [Bradymonadaceae bacterium TMQ3]RVU43646.1 hypothetical protein EA187_12535 [Lujinxingia sediminis]TXC75824.1 hypothetical protein FRC91_09995 [Bradymonadales bacterium TMQ1]
MSEEANQSAQDNNPEGGGSKRRRRRRRRRSRSSKGSSQTTQNTAKSESGESEEGVKPSGGKKKSREGAKSKNRRQSSRRSRGSSRRKSRNRSSGKRRQRRKTPVRKLKTPESKLGGREPVVDLSAAQESRRGPVELTPFEVFCAYHCGITENNNYRQQSLREVASRFNMQTHELEKALREFGLDKETVKSSRFDISLCQLDMKVAPEGIDKRELARVLFDEFLDETPRARERVEAFEASSQAQPDEASGE